MSSAESDKAIMFEAAANEDQQPTFVLAEGLPRECAVGEEALSRLGGPDGDMFGSIGEQMQTMKDALYCPDRCTGRIAVSNIEFKLLGKNITFERKDRCPLGRK